MGGKNDNSPIDFDGPYLLISKRIQLPFLEQLHCTQLHITGTLTGEESDNNIPNVENANPPKFGTGTPNVVGAGALRPNDACTAVSEGK